MWAKKPQQLQKYSNSGLIHSVGKRTKLFKNKKIIYLLIINYNHIKLLQEILLLLETCKFHKYLILSVEYKEIQLCKNNC